jgi:hypothetical protein
MASSSRLKPGEKGSITARVDTSQRNGFLIKTIQLLNNDPNKPTVVLTLKAMIQGPPSPHNPPVK